MFAFTRWETEISGSPVMAYVTQCSLQSRSRPPVLMLLLSPFLHQSYSRPVDNHASPPDPRVRCIVSFGLKLTLWACSHKSYHPYLEKNKQRVREDEAKALAEETLHEQKRLDTVRSPLLYMSVNLGLC